MTATKSAKSATKALTRTSTGTEGASLGDLRSRAETMLNALINAKMERDGVDIEAATEATYAWLRKETRIRSGKLVNEMNADHLGKVVNACTPFYQALLSKQQQVILAKIQFDGGSRGNPGKAVGAAIVEVGGVEHVVVSEVMNHATNNEAEYCGLIVGLEKAIELGATHLEIEGDSQLVINQVKLTWKCSQATLLPSEMGQELYLDRYRSGKSPGSNAI